MVVVKGRLVEDEGKVNGRENKGVMENGEENFCLDEKSRKE